MNNEITKLLKPAVNKAAHQAERRWNSILPADDIEEELWLFILESQSVQDYLTRNTEGSRIAALKMKADSICSKEKTDYEHFTGNYLYTSADVRRLLENLTRDKRLLDAERIDLELGLEQLKRRHEKYYKILVSHYKEGYVAAQGAEQNAKSRAVIKLTNIMNRKHSQRLAERTEGLGTRPAITTNQEEY